MPQAVFIKEMFNSVSDKYDLLNDLLSLGTHRIWKKKLRDSILKNSPKSFLDCATGTGDIAKLVKLKAKETRVKGIDFSPKMISLAQKKHSGLDFEVQDLLDLSFESKSFDVSAVSFGIRNVEDVPKALGEMARVSKDKVYVMEFGQPENKAFRRLYFMMMKYLIPLTGRFFKRKSAYKYLIDSSSSFPSGQAFADIMLQSTGFKSVTARPLFGGIVYIYEAGNI